MPRYKVIAPGFANGVLYKPDGKRSVLHTDKPFNKKNNPMPSWVTNMPKESDGARKKRESREATKAETDATQAEQDQKDIDEASFLGDGESGSNVETV